MGWLLPLPPKTESALALGTPAATSLLVCWAYQAGLSSKPLQSSAFWKITPFACQTPHPGSWSWPGAVLTKGTAAFISSLGADRNSPWHWEPLSSSSHHCLQQKTDCPWPKFQTSSDTKPRNAPESLQLCPEHLSVNAQFYQELSGDTSEINAVGAAGDRSSAQRSVQGMLTAPMSIGP